MDMKKGHTNIIKVLKYNLFLLPIFKHHQHNDRALLMIDDNDVLMKNLHYLHLIVLR